MSDDTPKGPESGPAQGDAKYRVGTLEYTKRGLVMLFIWLLWGDFCFTIMEAVFPWVTPLTMRNLGSSNLVIGLVVTTIPSIFNFFICPWISFKSDRHRSKWGRRRPFMLLPTPFIAILLVLIGLSPDIGRFLGSTIFRSTGFTQAGIALVLIGVFSAGFQYFNMFVASVYYYFFNDVVPEQFLGRFMSMFRVVGTLAGAAFSYFVFPYAETHMKWIFIGAGVLYFVAFMTMSLRVKEGEYPDPPEYVDGKQGLLSGMKTYFVECFSHRFYWYFFAATTLWELTYCIGPFQVFMQQRGLGLELAQIGKINGAAQIVTALLVIPAGILSDRKHPIRTVLYATAGLVLLTPTRLMYLFVDLDPATAFKVEFGLQMLLIPLVAVYVASNLPMYMRLLPGERYGQYCAAQAMVRSLAVIGAGALAGWFMDLTKRISAGYGMPEFYYYKFVPVWTWLFQILSLILMIRLYRYWKQYGGDTGYTPPAVGCVAEGERNPAAQASRT